MAITALADRILERLASRDPAKGEYGMHRDALLKMLHGIMQIDQFPDQVVEREEALAEIAAAIGRSMPDRRALRGDFCGPC